MVKPIELSKTEVGSRPYLIWNAFIQLLVESRLEELNDMQIVPLFAFWYDSEVQNGGHLQYFENKGKHFRNNENILVNSTLKALNILGATQQADIYSTAATKYFSQVRKHPQNVEEFCMLELEDEFGEYDRRYYKCVPDMSNLLELYLQDHLAEFVKLI